MSSPPPPPPVYHAGMPLESNGPSLEVTSGQGSLGCFAQDKEGKTVLLTCAHVMFPGFGALPQVGIYQPDHSTCCSSGPKIATPVIDGSLGDITKWDNGKYVAGFKIKLGDFRNDDGITFKKNARCSQTDCAIARLDPGTKFENVIHYEAKVGSKTEPRRIEIKGAVDSLVLNPGPKLGTVPPTKEQYVRIYLPQSGRLLYGTFVYFRPFVHLNGNRARQPDGGPVRRSETGWRCEGCRRCGSRRPAA